MELEKHVAIATPRGSTGWDAENGRKQVTVQYEITRCISHNTIVPVLPGSITLALYYCTDSLPRPKPRLEPGKIASKGAAIRNKPHDDERSPHKHNN